MTKYLKRFLLFICFFISIYFVSLSNVEATSIATSDIELYCNNNLVMDANTGNVLFEKNGYNKVYPASTTKILTALLAIENLDSNKTIIASRQAIYSTPAGSSIAYIKVGEELSLENLLYCLLLISGNDAANVVAEAVSGSNDEFIDLMNEKLKEIGCNNTHFTNAHGFHDDDHYTTPYDMAILMRYAMQNETFRKIIETKKITIPKTNKSNARKCTSTNKMFDPDYEKMYYEHILGGKTGYTEEARGTFVGYGKKEDKLVIVCSFNGSQNINKQEARFLDTKTLMEYSFNSFNNCKVVDKEKFEFDIIDNENDKIYTVSINDDTYALCGGEYIYASYDINVDNNVLNKANISSNVGTARFKLTGDNLEISVDKELVLINVSNYKDFSNLYILLKYILIILIILLLLKIRKSYIKNKRNKKNKNKYYIM